MEDATCGRCGHLSDDRRHAFFNCNLSKDVWTALGLSLLSDASDTDVWALPSGFQQDPETWPFVLLSILRRLWDARNGAVFRNERQQPRDVITRVCDDLNNLGG